VPSGKKKLKVNAVPSENLPIKSIQRFISPPRRELVKHALPPPIVHRDFEAICKFLRKHHLGKLNSLWNFSLYETKVCKLLSFSNIYNL